MKRSHIFAVLAALLIPPFGAAAQDASLFYRLQAGETYFLEIDLQQNTQSESVDSEEISFYKLTGMKFRVDSMDHSGNFHLSVRYKDLMISMLAPQMHLDISSASGKNRMLTEMVDMLEQATFQMVMTPQGEVLSHHGLKEVFAPLATVPTADTSELQVVLKTLEEAYGSDAFTSLCNVFLYTYPVIQPLSNWTNDITYHFNTKAVKMVNRYYLTKANDEAVVIQGIGMLNAMKEFHETTGMGEVKSAVTGSQTYDFRMEPESGWPTRCISRQRVMIETTILRSSYLPAGLKIPSYTETTFEVRGGKLEGDFK